MPLELLDFFTWQSIDVELVSLSVRIDDLAARLGIPVREYYKDGLGPSRYFAGRLPSGLFFSVEELEMCVKYHGALGPSVLVDATALAANGIEPLVSEILQSLGLARSELVYVADDMRLQAAIHWASKVGEYRLKHDGTS